MYVCVYVIGQFVIGQFVIGQFNKPITFNHIQSCYYVCVRARLLLCFCRLP